MNFIQPWMLVALPLVAVPIIIHLVNQRRFQTVPWAAMMFLMQASRMSAGYTKLRQWLILLMRALAVACLIFFTSRPLASGLIGLLGSRSSEVAIVLLDRSPSMQEAQAGSGATKLQGALQQLSGTLKTLGVQRVIVFDTASEKPIELETPSAMVSDPSLVANGLTSDIPGMLERALLYVKNNRTGNVNIWICSDMRESDWRSRDGRWAADREGFISLPQEVRFQILDLGAASSENRSIRILSAKRVKGPQGVELSLSFRIERTLGSGAPTALQIPVEIEVGGARSVVNVDLQSEAAEVNDYRIALSSENDNAGLDQGWGVVRCPGDINPADNTSYFVYEKPPARHTVIVSDNPRVIEAIELCTNISPEQAIECETETVASSQLDSIDWNAVALVVWHEQLPEGRSLELLTQFIAQGGQVLLFPPETPNDTAALGIQWTGWQTLDSKAKPDAETVEGDVTLAKVLQWRNDSELLGNTLNGAPLPVGQLGIKRICKLRAEGTVLAAMSDELPLLMRIDATGSSKNGVYVCTTTPSLRDSTLASDGIVMYIAIQRVLAAGSERIGATRMVTVGQPVSSLLDAASQAAGDSTILTNQYAQNTGVYRTNDLLIAQNRLGDEDSGKLVSAETLSSLFGALNWSRIEVGASAKSLVQEIWRWFLIIMLVALVVEAMLCMPKRRAVAMTKVN
ncbi:MAG: BatA domain-containing protein [Planctomycetota bacterium]|nr:BatA domain-containing protein [Planctomycetota bacterium]